MTPIAPSVLADWGAWTAPLEGRVATLYLDTKGLPTTGLGCLLPSLAASQALPWLRSDGAHASADEIRDDWRRVMMMARGLKYTRYAADPSALHLSDDAIDALARVRLQQDADILAQHFPAFATFPAPAQRALLSMAWAMGGGFATPRPGHPAPWPHFSAAVLARRWDLAAESCKIDEVGEPGVVPRNKLNKALFLEAAATEHADPGHRVPGSDEAFARPFPSSPPSRAGGAEDAPCVPAAQAPTDPTAQDGHEDDPDTDPGANGWIPNGET